MARRWDKTPRSGIPENLDFGDIGEDQTGIWIADHPYVLLTRRPQLMGPVAEFWAALTEPTPEDYDTRLSAWEYSAKLVMASAKSRAQMPKRDTDGN